MTNDHILVGELRDHLVAAMQRVPELAGRVLVLPALSGGITNRNFLVTIPGADDRYVIRLAGNDTHLLGIDREVEHAATVAAAGVGVGPEVTAFIRPEGYLVTRFIDGSPVSDVTVHQPATLERVAQSLAAHPRGPGHPGSVRAAADRGGLPSAGGRPRSTDSPGCIRYRRPCRPPVSKWPASRTRSRCGRAATTSSTRTSSTTVRASASSTGSTPAWATRSSTSATSASTTS